MKRSFTNPESRIGEAADGPSSAKMRIEDEIEGKVFRCDDPSSSFDQPPYQSGQYIRSSQYDLNEDTDLVRKLKKFWNGGCPDILKLGQAKVMYEENVGPAEKHLQKFIAEIVKSGEFDIASVGSFARQQQSLTSVELLRAFFEGSAILQTIAIRIALSATNSVEKWESTPVQVPQPSSSSFPQISRSFSMSQSRPSSNPQPTSSIIQKPGQACPRITVNPANVRKPFWIEEEGDFRRINLTTLLENWQPPKTDVAIALKACYRKIFGELTREPQDIKQYTIRFTNKGRRVATMKDLPKHIMETMTEYSMALTDLDHPEIFEANPLPKTRFVMNLGDNDSDRMNILFYLAEEKRSLLGRIPRLLQDALADIRTSTMEIVPTDDGNYTVAFKNSKRKIVQPENYPEPNQPVDCGITLDQIPKTDEDQLLF